MRSTVLLAALSAIFATSIAHRASAASVQATLEGMPYKAAVTICATTSGGYSISEYVYAGMFQWQGVPDNPWSITGKFNSFCIDIKDSVSFGQTYHYQTGALELSPISNGVASGINADLAGGMAADKATLIRELWAAKFASINSDATAAAFQLAVWNIIYETQQDWTISSGQFHIQPGTLSVPLAQTLANQWLGELRDGEWTAQGHVMAIASDQFQDQVVVGAPLPAAVWAGIALLGILGTRSLVRRLARPA